MDANDYECFIRSKAQLDNYSGFEATHLPAFLFPFQRALVEWAVRKGRGGMFADCGLGKTVMELAWAQNIYEHTGQPVLILTPLAVASQFLKEANHFGYEASRSVRGEITAPIVIANYERLHLFDTAMFGGVVCDESSILKSFSGVRRLEITEFMRKREYRLLGTATAAPNDYTELGTASEALGYLGYMDMLGRFFTNRQRTSHQFHGKYRLTNNDGWRFKGHAEEPFWQWVSSWARALRKPSDLGFSDEGFDLPPLNIEHHVVESRSKPDDMLFNLPAIGFHEQRAERRRTIAERCEAVAELVNETNDAAVVWCHLNDEADTIVKLVPDAQQVSGRDSDEGKEAKFEAFSNGELRVLVTKPKIGAWGLNWQHCNHIVFFPSHSYEQYYQAVRRCWRFGQKRAVKVDIVATPGQVRIQENLQRKTEQAAEMFTALVAHMSAAQEVERLFSYNKKVEVPSWL